MKLLFSKLAKQEYDLIKADAPDLAAKIKAVLKEMTLHPDSGSCLPTKLEGIYAGLWQRTYVPGHVIVYSFDKEAVTIVSIGAEARAFNAIHLEAYSSQDEKSVMSQMESNRGNGLKNFLRLTN